MRFNLHVKNVARGVPGRPSIRQGMTSLIIQRLVILIAAASKSRPDCDTVGPFRAEHDDRAAERVLLQDRLHRPCHTVGAAAEINRVRDDLHSCPRWQAPRQRRSATVLATAPGAKLSVPIAACSAALQRR